MRVLQYRMPTTQRVAPEQKRRAGPLALVPPPELELELGVTLDSVLGATAQQEVAVAAAVAVPRVQLARPLWREEPAKREPLGHQPPWHSRACRARGTR